MVSRTKRRAGEFCIILWKKLDKMVGTKVSKLAEAECKVHAVAQESKLYSADSSVGKLVCTKSKFHWSGRTIHPVVACPNKK